MKRISPFIFCTIIFCMISCNNGTSANDALATKAMEELRTTLRTQSQFIKVHAAEYLIWLGYPEEVKEVYLSENELYSAEKPYRIGIWRVLAQTEEKPEDKSQWVNKVLEVYGDTSAPDRLHATETLAKLQQSPISKYPDLTQQTLASENRNLGTYALWAFSYTSDSALKKNTREFVRLAMEDSVQVIRKISAYILRTIGGLTEGEWTLLAEKALSEPDTTGMRYSLLNTVFVTLPEGVNKPELYKKIQDEMVKNNDRFSAGERIELALSLADKGTPDHLPVLEAMLNNANAAGIYEPVSKEGADVRATAAYAIIKIKQQEAITE